MKYVVRILFFSVIIFQFSFLNIHQRKPRQLDLENIKRISRASYLVQHEYYDKDRNQLKKMLEEGFYELAKEIPEFLPKFISPTTLYVQLGGKTKIEELGIEVL